MSERRRLYVEVVAREHVSLDGDVHRVIRGIESYASAYGIHVIVEEEPPRAGVEHDDRRVVGLDGQRPERDPRSASLDSRGDEQGRAG